MSAALVTDGRALVASRGPIVHEPEEIRTGGGARLDRCVADGLAGYATGRDLMHDGTRMIVASFLVKDLLVDRRETRARALAACSLVRDARSRTP